MDFKNRNFFSYETLQEKTKKYTRPYPIVTQQLLSLRQQQTTFRNATTVPLSLDFAPSFPAPLVFPQAYTSNSVIPDIKSPQITGEMNRKRRNLDVYDNFSAAENTIKRKRSSLIARGCNINGKFSQLSNEIIGFWEHNMQSDGLLLKKLQLRSALLHLIKQVNPNASLHLVGSSCNGFATNNSDADFCVMLTQQRMIDQRYEACFYLKNIQKSLKKMLFKPVDKPIKPQLIRSYLSMGFHNVTIESNFSLSSASIKRIQFIKAKVPILKFKDAVSGCECDVNVNNATGIRNTHLLRTYSKVDNRLSPLVLCIKKWARARDINDASQSTLSSYSLVLMIIHYLQSGCHPPVFKSLQLEYPEFFRADSNVNGLSIFDPAELMPCNSSSNKEPVGQLLAGFFEYYAEKYQWNTHVISIRLGTATTRSNRFEWKDKFICIEEPFDLTNTARAVYNYDKFRQIKLEFNRAHRCLQRDLSFEKLCNREPLSRQDYLILGNT